MKVQTYICECGKTFANPQSFNGHKCHCLVHRTANGSLNNWLLIREQNNNKAKNTLKEKYKQINIEKENLWISEKHVCERCGNIMTKKFGSGRFCSKSCACKRKHSEEEKEKIRKSVLNYKSKLSHENKITKTCSVCGKQISKYSKTGICRRCLSTTEEGKAKLSDIGKLGYQHQVKNGTHIPWKSRKITSYAEKFWIDVLTNNNIEYQREYLVKHNSKHYFLDFFITKNGIKIDLEIDGKQHKYSDRHEHDIERDSILQEAGYQIYRIPWNEINSENGKLTMKNKIDNFINFYNKL